MKSLVKVDRVCSLHEAIELQNLGADIITVPLAADCRFSDSRCVSLDVVREIRRSLTRSLLCCEIESVSQFHDLLHEEIDFIQISRYTSTDNNLPVIDNETQSILKSKGVGIIYSGIEASYEDAPEWIAASMEERPTLVNHFFQVDLLADMANSWSFLQDESYKHEELLKIDEINDLASKFPLFITLDLQPRNIKEVLSSFPKAQGISFTLGENSVREGFHWISYSDLVENLIELNV